MIKFVANIHEVGIGCMIGSLLEKDPDIYVVGTDVDDLDLPQVALSLSADVVAINSIHDAAIDTYRVLDQLRNIVPGSEVLMISNEKQSLIVEKMMQYGARGFISKQYLDTDLQPAIYAVSKRERFIGHDILVS